MKKLFGGALALLSAFVMISSATPAQAQGLVNTLRGIASDPSVDNYLRTKFSGYSNLAPINGYVGYNNGYYPPVNGYNNGGLLNSLGNGLLGNNYYNNGNVPYNGYGYNGNLDPTLYPTSYGNTLNGAANWNAGNNWSGSNGNGRHHKRHHHSCGGPNNGFYSMQNGAALGGIGYNPYTLGR